MVVKTGNSFNPRCIRDRHEIPKAIPMFPWIAGTSKSTQRTTSTHLKMPDGSQNQKCFCFWLHNSYLLLFLMNVDLFTEIPLNITYYFANSKLNFAMSLRKCCNFWPQNESCIDYWYCPPYWIFGHMAEIFPVEFDSVVFAVHGNQV
jgi:hypothetical protein